MPAPGQDHIWTSNLMGPHPLFSPDSELWLLPPCPCPTPHASFPHRPGWLHASLGLADTGEKWTPTQAPTHTVIPRAGKQRPRKGGGQPLHHAASHLVQGRWRLPRSSLAWGSWVLPPPQDPEGWGTTCCVGGRRGCELQGPGPSCPPG